ncbi:unnamed protein product [Lathyrus sativus]|nr:unnamed protein product [Lathyrus sativus]
MKRSKTTVLTFAEKCKNILRQTGKVLLIPSK